MIPYLAIERFFVMHHHNSIASFYKTARAKCMKINISNFALSSHNVFTMTVASAIYTWLKICFCFFFWFSLFNLASAILFPPFSWADFLQRWIFLSDHFNR